MACLWRCIVMATLILIPSVASCCFRTGAPDAMRPCSALMLGKVPRGGGSTATFWWLSSIPPGLNKYSFSFGSTDRNGLLIHCFRDVAFDRGRCVGIRVVTGNLPQQAYKVSKMSPTEYHGDIPVHSLRKRVSGRLHPSLSNADLLFLVHHSCHLSWDSIRRGAGFFSKPPGEKHIRRP